MNDTSNNIITWNKYLEDINLPHQSSIHDYCYQNTDTALQVLSNFHPDYVSNFWIGPGWIPTVFELHLQLSKIDPHYVIYQIKEKFGGLRFYAESINPIYADTFDSLISAAETKSLSICELCSSPANVMKDNYLYRTLCAGCKQPK